MDDPPMMESSEVNKDMKTSPTVEGGPEEYVDPDVDPNGRFGSHRTSIETSAMRGGTRVTVATREQVEGQMTKSEKIRLKHIVRIFSKDPEIREVTPEQIERVKMMHARMEEGSYSSFNYNSLLFFASILAALGLVSNSSAVIIASMLVSPLMGPVIGLAYGTSIKDLRLVRESLKTETLSLAFCIFMGMMVGFCTGPSGLSDSWPTDEMKGRGSLTNFLVGLPVAWFSGMGVAVSLLDDQTASLVGVAISASLLPPAVNAGLLWVAYFFTKLDVIHPLNTENIDDAIAPLIDGVNAHIEGDQYSKTEYRKMGFMSLSLTLANIFLIWLSSMLMFRIKEVLPVKKNVFWDDLGAARKIYQRRAFVRSVNRGMGQVEPVPSPAASA